MANRVYNITQYKEATSILHKIPGNSSVSYPKNPTEAQMKRIIDNVFNYYESEYNKYTKYFNISSSSKPSTVTKFIDSLEDLRDKYKHLEDYDWSNNNKQLAISGGRTYNMEEYMNAINTLKENNSLKKVLKTLYPNSSKLEVNYDPNEKEAKTIINAAFSFYSDEYNKYATFFGLSENDAPKTVSEMKSLISKYKNSYQTLRTAFVTAGGIASAMPATFTATSNAINSLQSSSSTAKTTVSYNDLTNSDDLPISYSSKSKKSNRTIDDLTESIGNTLGKFSDLSNALDTGKREVALKAAMSNFDIGGARGGGVTEVNASTDLFISGLQNGLADISFPGTSPKFSLNEWPTVKSYQGKAVATDGLSEEANSYTVVGNVVQNSIIRNNGNITFRSIPKNIETGDTDNFSKWIYSSKGYPTLVPYSYEGGFDNWMNYIGSKRWENSIGLTEEDKILHRKLGLDANSYQDFYQNFNRYYNIYPNLEISSLTSWVFITRPDLWLFKNDYSDLAGNKDDPTTALRTAVYYDPYINYMYSSYPIILKMLTPGLNTDHDFIPFLMDRTEMLQLQDINVKTEEISQLHTGYRMNYAGNSIDSTSGGSVDLSFREDSQLRVTKFFNTWLHYIDYVTRDLFRPRAEYIYLHKLDYVCSIYQIICDPTGENILYFAKYTGCFPVNVNHANFSHQLRGEPDTKVDVQFAYSHFDALNLEILGDFNLNSRKRGPIASPVTKNGLTGEYIVGAPFIYHTRNGFKLLWNTAETDLKTS